MSDDRKDLVAILRALQLYNNKDIAKLEQEDTNLQLLRRIVDDLEKAQATGRLNSNQLPDSLAFPKGSRDKLDLHLVNELWDELKNFNDLLKQDYACRKQMLISRLDCTVESFKWKSSAHLHTEGKVSFKSNKSIESNQNHNIDKAFKDKDGLALKSDPEVSMSHLLALRETDIDHLLNKVVSSSTVDCRIENKCGSKFNTETHVNLKQFIIPCVPDRGGRPDEIKAPSKETFSQQRHAKGRR